MQHYYIGLSTFELTQANEKERKGEKEEGAEEGRERRF